MSKQKRLATADAVHILYRRYYEGRPERVKRLDGSTGERQRGAEVDRLAPSRRYDPATIGKPGGDNGISYLPVGKCGL